MPMNNNPGGGINLSESQYDKWSQQQQENRPWMQKNPGMATGLAGGAALGGGMLGGMLGGGGMFGKPEKLQQQPLFSPEIMKLKNMMGPQIWEQIMGNQFDFQPIEDLTRQNFQSKTMPSLMNRFNMGNDRGSGSQWAGMQNAGQGLDAQLAAMRQGYGQQRQGLLASLMPSAMGQSFENVNRPAQAGGMEQAMSAMLKMLPMILPFL